MLRQPAIRSRVPSRSGVVQRCGGKRCPAGTCDHRPPRGLGASQVPPVVHEALRAPGRPLDASSAALMGSRFGHDFGRVRVHTDGRAARAARAVGADAFTVGHDVVFGAGRWGPHTRVGRRLLAHELAHVVQQRGTSAATDEGLKMSSPQDPAEREAEEVATGFGPRWPVQTKPAPHLRLARQQAGGGAGPPAPVLNPADPRVGELLERLDPTAAAGSERSVDPRCQAAVGEAPPWMPKGRRPSPITLGEGSRRHPKLKEPDGPSGAKCRGACGADCPDTCKTVGTYSEQYLVGNCGYVVEFPDALLCGTHAGCRSHDACFDTAVAKGETYLFGPLHNQCNQDAAVRWPAHVSSWARGGGPYDAWWYFVDDPIIRRSWRVERPP